MPSPTIRCEFCENHEMRRDAYAAHVKAKHMKEIALLMLKDFKDSLINTIAAYAADKDVKSMPIHSEMYQDAEYWFGVKPLFYIRESNELPHDATRPDTKLKPYTEDQELTQYLKRQENLTYHKNFIEECLKQLSFFDFMNQQKKLIVRDASVVTMKNQLMLLTKEHEALKEITNRERERLQKEIELWKETAEEKEFIADLKKDISYYKAYSSRIQKELDYTKKLCEEKDKEHEENVAAINQRRCSELSYAEERNDVLRKENIDLKKTMDKKVQKLVDKERKEERKEKQKAKKAIKKAKKLAELSNSDSDSGSESD